MEENMHAQYKTAIRKAKTTERKSRHVWGIRRTIFPNKILYGKTRLLLRNALSIST